MVQIYQVFDILEKYWDEWSKPEVLNVFLQYRIGMKKRPSSRLPSIKSSCNENRHVKKTYAFLAYNILVQTRTYRNAFVISIQMAKVCTKSLQSA